MNKTDRVEYRPLRTSIDLSGDHVDIRRSAPPTDLTPFVEEFWQYTVSPELDYLPVQVFPSGCITLRFNIMPRGVDALIYGPSTNNNMKGLFFQEWLVVGAAIRPERACHLLGLTLAELRDLRVHMDCFWPQLIGDLKDQIQEARTFQTRTKLITTFLRRILQDGAAPASDFLNTFQDLIKSAPHAEDIGITAKRHQISCRTMRRHFQQYLGISPKEMDRIARVQGSMRQLMNIPTYKLTELSGDHGYSDQSHLTREFRSIVGLSPKRFASLVGHIEDKTLPEWADLNPDWRNAKTSEVVLRFK